MKYFSDVNDFLPTKPTSNVEDLQNYLLEHQYIDGMEPPADERVLFYNGVPIGSRGNIIAINGKAKSRKSVIASAIMSSALTLDHAAGFLGFTCTLLENAKVLNFDTEQGLGHWIEGSRRVIRDAGHDKRPAGFYSHHTRECDVDLRLQLFEYSLKIYQPDIAILDGITDIVYDLNSQEEATRVGGKLMQWSVMYNCLIVTIIHITKGTGYMTGALGSYLEKKCQTAIKCEKDEKDDNVSHITCQYARDKGFPPFGIMYNDTEGHYIRIDQDKYIQSGPKANNGPGTKDDVFKKQFIDAIFRVNKSHVNITALRSAIKKAGNSVGLGEMSNPDIKAWYEFYSKEMLIIPHPDFGFVQSETVQIIKPDLDFNKPHESNPADELSNAKDDLPF